MKKKTLLTFTLSVMWLIIEVSISYSATITLSYNSMWPSAYGQAQPVVDFAKEIEKRTNGRVKITVYHAGALTSPVEIYEGVVTGVSDIGQACFAYGRGRFPLLEVLDLPGQSSNAVVNSLVANKIYEKFRPKETNDVHMLYLHNHGAGTICTRTPVRKLEDLKGLKLRGVGMNGKIIKALGALPVGIPAGESYDAIRKGVVDGAGASPNMLKGFRFAEVAKYTVINPKTGYLTGFYVVMNPKRWNSLPKDIQRTFQEVSKEWQERTGKCWNEMEIEGYNWAKKRGHKFTYLSPEESARWSKKVKPLLEKYVEDTEKKGLPGKEALNYREELLKKYSETYSPIIFK
jgi:TRAP-type C4-dicarboxylate transport system substrate-binding protein